MQIPTGHLIQNCPSFKNTPSPRYFAPGEETDSPPPPPVAVVPDDPTVPSGYVCRRGNVPGHWIHACPDRTSAAAGIPGGGYPGGDPTTVYDSRVVNTGTPQKYQ